MPFLNYNIYRLNTTSLRHNQLIGLVTDSLRVTKNFLSLDDEDTILTGRVKHLEGLLEQYNQTQNMVRKSIVTADLDNADKKTRQGLSFDNQSRSQLQPFTGQRTPISLQVTSSLVDHLSSS